MDELSQQANQKRNGLLDAILIIGILSGSLFDAVDFFLNTKLSLWSDLHYILKDLQTLSITALAFTMCSYNSIKIKAFLFMFVIWRAIVLTYNIYLPDFKHQYILIPLYSTYILWIFRTLLINETKPEYQDLHYINRDYAYNIYFPVSTFRGLLQALFTLKNPKYETRMMIFRDKLHLVYNNMFTIKDYNREKLERLINDAGAIIKNKGIPDTEKIQNVYNLSGKSTIFAFRDCRKLEL